MARRALAACQNSEFSSCYSRQRQRLCFIFSYQRWGECLHGGGGDFLGRGGGLAAFARIEVTEALSIHTQEKDTWIIQACMLTGSPLLTHACHAWVHADPVHAA